MTTPAISPVDAYLSRMSSTARFTRWFAVILLVLGAVVIALLLWNLGSVSAASDQAEARSVAATHRSETAVSDAADAAELSEYAAQALTRVAAAHELGTGLSTPIEPYIADDKKLYDDSVTAKAAVEPAESTAAFAEVLAARAAQAKDAAVQRAVVGSVIAGAVVIAGFLVAFGFSMARSRAAAMVSFRSNAS